MSNRHRWLIISWFCPLAYLPSEPSSKLSAISFSKNDLAEICNVLENLGQMTTISSSDLRIQREYLTALFFAGSPVDPRARESALDHIDTKPYYRQLPVRDYADHQLSTCT